MLNSYSVSYSTTIIVCSRLQTNTNSIVFYFIKSILIRTSPIEFNYPDPRQNGEFNTSNNDNNNKSFFQKLAGSW